MIKKLCEEIFKDDMSDYAIKIAYFTVAPELAKKLSKNEWDEFYFIFKEKLQKAEEKNPRGIFEIKNTQPQ
jgi:hypothetical protein